MSMGISRRQTLTGAAAVGVGLPLLAACGGASGSDSNGGPSTAPGEKLGPASEVPVGGGTIYAGHQIVVTQPAKGEFKAFSSICTHQGCPVTSVQNGTINCTCHGSKFSIEDGSVSTGPATKPLPPVSVTVQAGEITTA